MGLPVIVQACVGGTGEELNVVAVGDGEGGLVGAVAMKKLVVTDKGKGWAGITIKDPELLALTERFMRATHWRGPCEVEVIRDRDGDYHLIEINPRFPAWVYLSAAAGMNLPRAPWSWRRDARPHPLATTRSARCSCASRSTRSHTSATSSASSHSASSSAQSPPQRAR